MSRLMRGIFFGLVAALAITGCANRGYIFVD